MITDVVGYHKHILRTKFTGQNYSAGEIKAPTAEDLEIFRNQLRRKVKGSVDIDTTNPP